MKLNLDNPNVKEIELTVDQVRKLFDVGNESVLEELSTALDEAQGAVFTKEHKEYFIVIKVS